MGWEGSFPYQPFISQIFLYIETIVDHKKMRMSTYPAKSAIFFAKTRGEGDVKVRLNLFQKSSVLVGDGLLNLMCNCPIWSP